ncbi:SPOA family protein [Hyphomonas johnsonii MHS-2]|uniref:SPOA family protein n=2 Tax=Hyphomonas johnsonii TaxID=81031 RepID=A0A059FNJ4_9PROT|nr:SPOA family protein [Hyphomonas johnsonii MHS-2]
MHAFWEQLVTSTRTWAAETLGTKCEPVVASRRVVSGSQSEGIRDNQFTVFFGAEVSPGLSAVMIDERIAVRCGTVRLHQSADSLADASPLFLKLLCEQPVIALWNRIGKGLTEHKVDVLKTAQSDASATAGKFDANSRYLQVIVNITLGEEASPITFMFHLDYMQRYARRHVQNIVDRKKHACQNSPKSLSDSVRASAVALDAVLERVSLTIGECSRLQVGTVIPLANADAGKLSLSAETINGSVDIGVGELGVWKRQRALKLHQPIPESFARDLVDL